MRIYHSSTYSRVTPDIPSADQLPTDNAPFNSDDDDEMDGAEDAYDLREVSSDVEVNIDDAELDSDSEDAG